MEKDLAKIIRGSFDFTFLYYIVCSLFLLMNEKFDINLSKQDEILQLAWEVYQGKFCSPCGPATS
jgi:hypothetical protein